MVAVVAAVCTSCVSVSLHDFRSTEISVRDVHTNLPAPNLLITVDYFYDSYGVFYKLRVPDRVEARTDENGKVQVRLANWSQRIWLNLGERSALVIYADTVQTGGEFASFPSGVSGNVYNVRFRPL